ncbi:MAG: hypothetical protein A3I63_03760 [Betaproteobacteria bacterium RIFCSPLOWO2_02_FULL_66_14]|nr:MAG: hypothetical protein A3I63_03760 [Betaproteobacteria bacterium RIFCSPLOWO2_02_FULL_66_14]
MLLRLVWLLAVLACRAVLPANAEERFSFEATPGKLPKDVVPAHYALRIAPDAENAGFEARAEIDVRVLRSVAAVTLNAANLDIRSARLQSPKGGERALSIALDATQETLTLTPASGRIEAGEYRLGIDYAGRIGQHSQGLFRIAYKVSEQGRLIDKSMLATHFEPVHARKLFPGWDEPVFRATFEVTAVVDEALTVVSNMPVQGIVGRRGGKKEVTFARSVPMPTYLVALFVGELDAVEDELDGIRLSIYTVRGKTAEAQFAMQATKQILGHFNEYFGERYLLPKLDQVAVPGGFGGAMENWGAILYNEALLLVDPRAPSLRQQQRVHSIIAHEIAHQWFGNLVTMAWWDNLWLNEGFATWMATQTAARFHPEWRSRQYAALTVEDAMAEDARKTTHPVQTPVHDDARAFDLFDSITYAKGAAFLHMLETYLGEAAFREGVRRYLRAHRLSNATTADLWHHLSVASGRDVKSFAAPWTEQPGFPQVGLSQRCEGEAAVLRLDQRRFTLNDPGARQLTWPVPVTVVREGGESRKLLLDGASLQWRSSGCGAARVAADGYYRVRYDGGLAHRLVRDFPRLEAPERQRLLADTFAFVQAGESGVEEFLRLLEAMPGERDRFVLAQALESLSYLRTLVDSAGDRAAFDRYLVRVLREPLAQIGWSATAGEDSERPRLRFALIKALGLAGDAAVLREARARFASQATNPIDPSIRGAVLDVVGRHADAATFDRLLAMLRESTATERRWEYQSALRHVADPVLRLRWWTLLLGGEMPPGEAMYNLQHAGADSDSPEALWQFLKENLAAVYAKASPRGRAYLLPEAALAFSDEAYADELLRLTRQHLDAGALYQAEKAADAIRLAAAVKAKQAKTLVHWVLTRGGK